MGKPLRYQLSTGGKKVWLTYGHEYGTRRLYESRTDRENVTGVGRDDVYRYDDAGNVISITDRSRAGIDNQYLRYDDLLRLTDVWVQNEHGHCTGLIPRQNTTSSGTRPGKWELLRSSCTMQTRAGSFGTKIAGFPGSNTQRSKEADPRQMPRWYRVRDRSARLGVSTVRRAS